MLNLALLLQASRSQAQGRPDASPWLFFAWRTCFPVLNVPAPDWLLLRLMSLETARRPTCPGGFFVVLWTLVVPLPGRRRVAAQTLSLDFPGEAPATARIPPVHLSNR